MQERDKRRRRILVQELAALEALEASHREAVYAQELGRQARDEQRIAAMLLQTRQEKDIILENRYVLSQESSMIVFVLYCCCLFCIYSLYSILQHLYSTRVCICTCIFEMGLFG